MPIYEYQCTNCNHRLDLMQKVNEAPAKQCPKCFEQSLIKLVSAAGFQLKGTGWYATDFKDKNTKPKESSTVKKESSTTKDASGSAATDSGKGSSE